METNILLFVLVGFAAQLIDGALGMAYGVSSNTFLLSIGVPPAAASASVHLAEVVISGVSGFSHWRLGNTDRELIKRLLFPGVLGGVVGAYLLASFPGDVLKPYVSFYLLIMGSIILAKAFRRSQETGRVTTHLIPLGLVGGFFDAIGGGGWGPIVTTTLVARGNNPRYTIGSVNFAEFFVTFAESVTFLLTIGLTNWQIVVGLLIGGVVAAPIAALATRRLPVRFLMGFVGVLIILLSLRTIVMAIL
jgi:uncharacterized membrane protein YfcA